MELEVLKKIADRLNAIEAEHQVLETVIGAVISESPDPDQMKSKLEVRLAGLRARTGDLRVRFADQQGEAEALDHVEAAAARWVRLIAKR